jgi:YD repeat-containing protein
MRALFLVAVTICSLSSSAQYYYKDIIGTKESADLIRTYISNKVNRVILSSYDAENTRMPDFYVEQQFDPSTLVLKTITGSPRNNPSILLSYADVNGNVIRTVDSNNLVVSITSYKYNNAGQLTEILHNSSDSSGFLNKSDKHVWYWNGKKPERMLRIKNGNDTTLVQFKFDENGNVIEENETSRGVRSSPVLYYYNDENLLTDIVRHNPKVGILLPEFMFEYSDKGEVIQKITVPINNPDYLIWRYQYNANGLKTKEAIYDKYKSLSGKIEYQYSFGQ